jgi:hypothetical protein
MTIPVISVLVVLGVSVVVAGWRAAAGDRFEGELRLATVSDRAPVRTLPWIPQEGEPGPLVIRTDRVA